MVMDQTTGLFDTATKFYLSVIDASIKTNERTAEVARLWIEESLAAQQDLAESMRTAVTRAQETFTPADGAAPSPVSFFAGISGYNRSAYELWTETSLKLRDRYTRVAQQALDNIRAAQTEATARYQENLDTTTKQMSEFAARARNGVTTG
jgi:hypothetical protein